MDICNHAHVNTLTHYTHSHTRDMEYSKKNHALSDSKHNEEHKRLHTQFAELRMLLCVHNKPKGHTCRQTNRPAYCKENGQQGQANESARRGRQAVPSAINTAHIAPYFAIEVALYALSIPACLRLLVPPPSAALVLALLHFLT